MQGAVEGDSRHSKKQWKVKSRMNLNMNFHQFFQIGEKYVIDECDLHHEIKLGHKLNLRAGQLTNTFWF